MKNGKLAKSRAMEEKKIEEMNAKANGSNSVMARKLSPADYKKYMEACRERARKYHAKDKRNKAKILKVASKSKYKLTPEVRSMIKDLLPMHIAKLTVKSLKNRAKRAKA